MKSTKADRSANVAGANTVAVADFRFFKLGYASRLVLSGGLFALGAALELALKGSYIPGMVLAVAGWFLLMLKPATNKPEDQGLEEWRPVTMAEIDRLDDGLAQSRKLKRKTKSVATTVLVAIVTPVFLLVLLVASVLESWDTIFVILNAAIFLVPALFFGRVRVFLPKDIDFKMRSFRALLDENLPPGLVVAPYIRFDKDPAGRDVPEDLRIMLELKRPPADLVGVQIQAAINKGPNGEVPYLYAVVLTKGVTGTSYDIAQRVKSAGFEVEPGASGTEYGTVVIRQSTSGGGYHTDDDDCRKLLRLCVKLLERVQAAAGTAA